MEVNLGKVQFSVFTEEQARAMSDRMLIMEGINAPDQLTRELARRLDSAQSAFLNRNGDA